MIALVSVMVIGLLKNLSVQAAISKQVESNEKAYYLAEAGIQHAASTINRKPAFLGTLSWSDARINLPGTMQKHAYTVTVVDGVNGGKVVTSRGIIGADSKVLVRTISGKVGAMKKDRTRTVTRVCVEVSRVNLHAVICEEHGNHNTVYTRTFPWRRESTGLLSRIRPAGNLQPLCCNWSRKKACRIQNSISHWAENTAITRYTSGTPQKVAERVAELESQCTRFLLLGQGQKLAASTELQTEEGDHRALVSAFNRQALKIMLESAASLGIPVRSVKASPVLMAGLIHSLPTNSGGCGAENPG